MYVFTEAHPKHHIYSSIPSMCLPHNYGTTEYKYILYSDEIRLELLSIAYFIYSNFFVELYYKD